MAALLPDGVHPVVPEGGLLAVHAHPDDETLSTGALLATWAAADLPVTVVTCTRGERGEVIALPGTPSEGQDHLEGDGPALAAYRERELAAALDALGVHDQLFLDQADTGSGLAAAPARYQDSGMQWASPGIATATKDSGPAAFTRVSRDESASRLASVLADRRPSVVVTYGPGGGYLHPDHVQAHRVTVRALSMLPTEQRPRLWCHAVPDVVLREQERAVARLRVAGVLSAGADGLVVPDLARAELPPLAVPVADLAGASAVAVRPVLGRLVAALRAHSTQVQGVALLPADVEEPDVLGCYALSNGVFAAIPAQEFYTVYTVSEPCSS